MADPTETPSKPIPSDPPPAESPTTARPIDFDDEQQETGVIGGDSINTPTRRPGDRQVHFNESEEAAPPRPPRPDAQAEATLIEAFPGIDAKVVKAVLTASGGQVEPAFNALLSMSDPDYVEEAPPAQPPRPTAQQRQVQQDELYARQLAEHYQYGGTRDRNGEQMAPLPRPQQGLTDEEREHSFFDDDLPEIRENLRQGFLTTQTKVNKWISDFRKRIDGEESAEEDPMLPQGGRNEFPEHQRRDFGASQSSGIRQMGAGDSARTRRSTDRAHYDADPRVISDNFTELELRDEEAEEEKPPPKPARPVANPDLFKPTPVAPQSGPVDEVDALYREPTPTNTPGQQRRPSPSGPGSAKSKKWQPLTSVAPNPETDDDGDPFSLGDSDEEKSKDLKAEDTERLKNAARASQDQGSAGNEGEQRSLRAEEHRGSVNKDADDLLKS